MIHSVLLVQRGITSGTHPVNGRSGKLYGTATHSGPHGGVVLQMQLSDYLDQAHDICGNTQPGQQWVPEFVSSGTETHVHKCDRCSDPAVAIWQQYHYCEKDSPDNATYLDGSGETVGHRKGIAPPAAPVTLPDAVLAPVSDKHQEIELPPEHMAAPRIGTDLEGVPATMAHVPPKPMVRPKYEQPEQPPTPTDSGLARDPLAKARTVVAQITDGVLTAILPKLEEIVDGKLRNLRLPNGAKKKSVKRTESDFTRLQKRAKELNINSFGKNAAQLQSLITIAESPEPAVIRRDPDPDPEDIPF